MNSCRGQRISPWIHGITATPRSRTLSWVLAIPMGACALMLTSPCYSPCSHNAAIAAYSLMSAIVATKPSYNALQLPAVDFTVRWTPAVVLMSQGYTGGVVAGRRMSTHAWLDGPAAPDAIGPDGPYRAHLVPVVNEHTPMILLADRQHCRSGCGYRRQGDAPGEILMRRRPHRAGTWSFAARWRRPTT